MARRRSRGRRRVVALALAASLLVIIIDVTVRSFADGPDRRLAYLDEARPSIEASTQQGLDLAELRTDAKTLDRVQFDRRVDRLRAESDATASAVRELEPPASLRDPHSFLLSALSIRAQASDRLARAFDTLLGGGTVVQAQTQLVAIGADLQVADRLYTLFATETERIEGGSRMPPSRWVADAAAWHSDAVGPFAQQLRSSGNLATVHDTGIVAVTLSPPPVATKGDAQVLATDEPLVVTAIVANRGSEDEAKVRVTARLEIPGRQPLIVSEEVALEAGRQRAVTLDPLQTVAGKTAHLVVSVAPVPAESVLADNRTELRLAVRNPAVTTTTAVPPATTVPTSTNGANPTTTTGPPG